MMQKHAIARAIAGARWNPRDGLIGSDQGLWLDPSDLSTMFQDSGDTTGTIPVTAVEQRVGLILDKSGRGNHAFAPTDAARPTLSARYNLLTKTEDFSDAVWSKQNLTVSANTTETTDPLGGNTADKIVGTATVVAHRVLASTTVTGMQTLSIKAKKAELSRLALLLGSAFAGAWFDLNSGTYGALTDYSGITSASITALSNGWYHCSITVNIATAVDQGLQILLLPNNGTSFGSATFACDQQGIYIWGADLRVANDALNQPAYQRVNTATDYDSDPTKFPRRINYASGQSHTVNFPSNLGSDCVIARANPGVSAVIAENQTVNTPLTLNTNHSGLVITSRDISVDEKARLDEYLDKKAIAK